MNQCANNSSILLRAGVDEAGRGPIAGPVVAAAVILPPDHQLTEQGLMDSKALSLNKRLYLYEQIIQTAIAWSLGVSSVAEIDHLNILQASLLAMQRAVALLDPAPQQVWVDGLHCPSCNHAVVRAVVRGDATVAEISAASVLAKVVRDWLMEMWHEHYPQYGFAQHKGYPTALHCQMLSNFGVTPLHRRSFKPVKQLLLAEQWQT